VRLLVLPKTMPARLYPFNYARPVTREARVPANQVKITGGGTLTLAESNKRLQWNYMGPRNP
jgi:hypothetical protein